MIENATIIIGTPESAQRKLREFLASHPNAAVLSSSVAVSHNLVTVHGTTETTDPDPPAKGKKAKPAEVTGIAKEYPAPIITVCIVAGIKL